MAGIAVAARLPPGPSARCRGRIRCGGRVAMLDRPAANIDISTDALKANLQRLEGEWETCQSPRGRDGIFGYLTAVFELVAVWKPEGTAVDYARWALWLRGHRSAVVSPEPFAAVIFCTADRKK